MNADVGQDGADLKRYEEIQKLFKDFKTETEKRQISSSENFDKSVLTYSSWALGISIAFLKDFIPIKIAIFPALLYLSWSAFVIAIILTTSSFLLSYKGLEVSLEHAAKYYLEENESYFNRKNSYIEIVKFANWISAVAFIIGLLSTLIFVSTNLERATNMKSKNPLSLGLEGLTGTMMTKIPSVDSTLNKGLPSAAMQKLPQSNIPASVPAQAPPEKDKGK